MMTKDFDVATFLDHLIFRWLRSNAFPDLLFTTQDIMHFRQAAVSGLAMPATCLIRTTMPEIEPESYGRSVLKREMVYNGDLVSVQLKDYLVKYTIVTAGYLMADVNAVNQRLANMDVDRYFTVDLSYLYPPTGRTRIEFRKTGQDFRPELNEETQARKVYTTVDWELRITLPCLDSLAFIDRINLFINEFPVVSIGG